MRNVFMLSAAALILSAGAASAQQNAVTQTPPPVKVPAAAAQNPDRSSEASVNWGYRGNSITGDEARFDRFRDSRAGMIAGANYNSESKTSALTFDAFNVGYRDQAYQLDYNNFGKLKVKAEYKQSPLNYAYNTLTPFQYQGNNVWTLDPTTRLNIQNKVAGYLGIGTTAAQFNLPSSWRALSTNFPMQAKRDIIDVGVSYALAKSLNLDLGVNSQGRKGNQPFGAAMAFNNAAELPLAIDDRNTDYKAALEWNKPGADLLRLQFVSSHFKNQFASLTWDSPIRATDFDNGKAPPAGPYDASGYSNGNGPATGRMALNPSSSMNTISLVGLHKMPGRTTLNGQVSYTKMSQNDALLPWTTNSKINNAAVWALFPGLKQLPRATAEAEIQAVNAQISFVSRPSDFFTFDFKYRFNDRENNTPVFDYSYNVRFDAVPEATPGESTVHYNQRRNTIETGATFNVMKNSALRFGYTMDDIKRSHRTFGDMTDYTFRVSYDSYANQYLTVRGVFEDTKRVGNGFSEEAIDESGSVPGLNFYDEADMARTKGTLIVDLTPSEKVNFGLSVASGKDNYNGEEHKFGLMDNTNTSYNANVTFFASKKLSFTGNYGYEKLAALQKARNANPLGVPPAAYESWNDANRDWAMNNDETVKTFGLSVDLIKAVANTDVRFTYDGSKSDNAFLFSGPRIQELNTNTVLTTGDALPCAAGTTNCFSQLPNVTNNWQQFGVQLKHSLSKKFGVDLGYQYEKLDIVDWATTNLSDGTPRMDPLGVISTGYGNRPYKGSVFTAKVSYNFQSAPFLF